ncbi:MAG TPA: hypothetical protein VGT61_09450 [Thermomicrobiales bacterium]|jgi:DNA-binding NtrC family response regulator|nr:hypothetical protein [Thermomicrobiales bacterium]
MADLSSSPILILNRDLFFGVRLRQALAADGWSPRIVPSPEALIGALDPASPAALVIIDMATDPDWATLVSAIRDQDPDLPVLAFGAHKDVDRFRAAKAGGVTRVISNGDFHRDMTGVVRRYARARGSAEA